MSRTEYQLRYASRCLKQTTQPNRGTACRFLDWKVGRDKRGTSTASHYAALLRDLDQSLKGKPFIEADHHDLQAYMDRRGRSLEDDSLYTEGVRLKHFYKWLLRERMFAPLRDLPAFRRRVGFEIDPAFG